MILYLVGMSCVGKTTIGKMVAERLGFRFFDLDVEVERYYKMPIERIQEQCFSMNGYRQKASVVLDILFSKHIDAVVAGTPSGLMFSYYRVFKKYKTVRDVYSIHVDDSCENVLNRLTFYDKNSNPIIEELSDSKKMKYLKKLKADYNYFKKSYTRADFKVNINNTQLVDIPNKLIDELQQGIKIASCQRAV